MKNKEIRAIDNITRFIDDTLRGEDPDPICRESFENPELQRLTECVNRWIGENRSMAHEIQELSTGNMDSSIGSRFAVSQSLKNLQATLKHITWQTRQVAEGDLSQRLEFLGDFSDSFNWMLSSLRSNREKMINRTKELRELASTDVLTGVSNRRSFFETGKREFARSKRYKNVISVFQMDIDFFKKINDTYGHAAGDEVLKLVTRTSVNRLRSSDFFGRLGGEEFGVIILNAGMTNALVLADRLRIEIAEKPLEYGDHLIQFTTSIGVATMGPKDETFDVLLARADEALYKAKKGGRNRVVGADVLPRVSIPAGTSSRRSGPKASGPPLAASPPR